MLIKIIQNIYSLLNLAFLFLILINIKTILLKYNLIFQIRNNFYKNVWNEFIKNFDIQIIFNLKFILKNNVS